VAKVPERSNPRRKYLVAFWPEADPKGGNMSPLLPIPFLALTVFLLIRAQFRLSADSGRRAAQWQVYVFKPLSTALVILVAALSFGAPGAEAGYTVGVLVGLILSLGGDVALMFPSAKAFLVGLVLFLLAHVAYAVVFTAFNGWHSNDLISGIVLLILAAVIYRYLEPGLGKMKGPVIGYMAIISLMVNRAISAFFGTAFTPTQAWLMALGAIAFWVSDLMLAVNRFRRPFERHHLSLVFYYGGQLLIALSPAYFG
jgi:uncharacterized membrane protein YhhN